MLQNKLFCMLQYICAVCREHTHTYQALCCWMSPPWMTSGQECQNA